MTYLERFAADNAIEPRTGVRVQRIDHSGSGWLVRSTSGEIPARHVIVATGYAASPVIPPWPGRESFAGVLRHAADYRNAEDFRDDDVLVAGAGSSGLEIADDLARSGAARVRLAVRTPPNILLRSVGGLPGDPFGVLLVRAPPRLADALTRGMSRVALGDLGAYGLTAPAEGPFARLRRLGVSPAVVDRTVINSIKDGRIEVVAAVEALHRTSVRLADRTRLEPDAVIAGTGYRCGHEPVVGHLGVLDERGVPRVVGGGEAAPGLRFVGFRPLPGQIRFIGLEARRAAREIDRGG